MNGGFLTSRPWLLVWVAFLLLIAAWTTIFVLSGTVSSQALTAEEEADLLRKREEHHGNLR